MSSLPPSEVTDIVGKALDSIAERRKDTVIVTRRLNNGSLLAVFGVPKLNSIGKDGKIDVAKAVGDELGEKEAAFVDALIAEENDRLTAEEAVVFRNYRHPNFRVVVVADKKVLLG